MESYYQETSRAGRGDQPANFFLFISKNAVVPDNAVQTFVGIFISPRYVMS
jgi:superfamily II DNA helicase RecQ